MALIVPSLLAADFARLGEALEIMRRAGATMVHIDVCDGHFAPGITVGMPVIARLRKATDLMLDVHLQVERAERFVPEIAGAGADRIAVHPESTQDFYRVLQEVRSKGVLAGAALNPATPVEAVREVVDDLDFLNILSADDGEGEQPYFPRTLQKLNAALDMRRELKGRYALQVEGGMTAGQIAELVEAGAGSLVICSVSFNHADAESRLRHLMRSASQADENITSTGSLYRE